MAGFPSVFGTLWKLFDDKCPVIAEREYSMMLTEDRLDTEKAAMALHFAVCKERNANARTERSNFKAWAAYIHFGV